MVEVHYFASIRESLGRPQDSVELTPGITTVAALIDELVSLHGEQWAGVLRQGKVLMAVNQVVARAETVLSDGDEVAFFPPVTGG